MQSSKEQVNNIIDLALAEDLIQSDATTEALIPPELEGTASMLVKAPGVLAGGEIVKMVFLRVDPTLKVKTLIKDGTEINPGDIINTVFGSVASILKAERTALNFISRLSGIATQAARYVAETQGLKANIVDTRKTTPGLRALEKQAVRAGGAHNHRFHLGDGVLIKDNHLVALRGLGISLKEIVARAKKNAPKRLKIEVEVNTPQEAVDAAEAGADIIMLDNMSPDDMRKIMNLLPDHIKVEASGGINLDNVRAAAESGVNIISVGALTHSVKALDISLELEPKSIKLKLI